MNGDKLHLVVETILGWCRLYGCDILRYPDNLRRYARNQMPSEEAAVDLCVDVISMDGFTNCLMWCMYFAGDQERLTACVNSFVGIIRASGRQGAEDMENVFRMFASGADSLQEEEI